MHSFIRPWKRAVDVLHDDIQAIVTNDPAARNIIEVLLYPGLHATILYRLAHSLWQLGLPILPRFISQTARFLTGIEIHPGARIGQGFFIDHGMGVVIGETTEIGNWVTLYQGVTLGGTGKQRGKRHPTIEDYAMIGVGASVLGAITVGAGARVGGGAVVVKDVPPHATAVGIPARIVGPQATVTRERRRVESLPDPQRDILRRLQTRLRILEHRLGNLEQPAPHAGGDTALFDTTVPIDLWRRLDENDHPRIEELMRGAGI